MMITVRKRRGEGPVDPEVVSGRRFRLVER